MQGESLEGQNGVVRLDYYITDFILYDKIGQNGSSNELHVTYKSYQVGEN